MQNHHLQQQQHHTHHQQQHESNNNNNNSSNGTIGAAAPPHNMYIPPNQQPYIFAQQQQRGGSGSGGGHYHHSSMPPTSSSSSSSYSQPSSSSSSSTSSSNVSPSKQLYSSLNPSTTTTHHHPSHHHHHHHQQQPQPQPHSYSHHSHHPHAHLSPPHHHHAHHSPHPHSHHTQHLSSHGGAPPPPPSLNSSVHGNHPYPPSSSSASYSHSPQQQQQQHFVQQQLPPMSSSPSSMAMISEQLSASSTTTTPTASTTNGTPTNATSASAAAAAVSRNNDTPSPHSQPPDSPTSDLNSDMSLKRPRRVAKLACVNCRKAHACCEDQRPCSRCMAHGLPCVDVQGKKRGRKKKADKDDGAADDASPSSVAALGDNDSSESTKPVKKRGSAKKKATTTVTSSDSGSVTDGVSSSAKKRRKVQNNVDASTATATTTTALTASAPSNYAEQQSNNMMNVVPSNMNNHNGSMNNIPPSMMIPGAGGPMSLQPHQLQHQQSHPLQRQQQQQHSSLQSTMYPTNMMTMPPQQQQQPKSSVPMIDASLFQNQPPEIQQLASILMNSHDTFYIHNPNLNVASTGTGERSIFGTPVFDGYSPQRDGATTPSDLSLSNLPSPGAFLEDSAFFGSLSPINFIFSSLNTDADTEPSSSVNSEDNALKASQSTSSLASMNHSNEPIDLTSPPLSQMNYPQPVYKPVAPDQGAAMLQPPVAPSAPSTTDRVAEIPSSGPANIIPPVAEDKSTTALPTRQVPPSDKHTVDLNAIEDAISEVPSSSTEAPSSSTSSSGSVVAADSTGISLEQKMKTTEAVMKGVDSEIKKIVEESVRTMEKIDSNGEPKSTGGSQLSFIEFVNKGFASSLMLQNSHQQQEIVKSREEQQMKTIFKDKDEEIEHLRRENMQLRYETGRKSNAVALLTAVNENMRVQLEEMIITLKRGTGAPGTSASSSAPPSASFSDVSIPAEPGTLNSQERRPNNVEKSYIELCQLMENKNEMDSSSFGIMLCFPGGRIISLNKTLLDRLGYDPADLFEKLERWEDVVHPEFYSMVVSQLTKLLRAAPAPRKSFRCKVGCRAKDGSKIMSDLFTCLVGGKNSAPVFSISYLLFHD